MPLTSFTSRLTPQHQIQLRVLTPVLGFAVALMPGVLLVRWLGAGTSLYGWALVFSVALLVAVACAFWMGRRLYRLSLHANDDLAQTLRRRLLNRQFDVPPAEAGNASELAVEIQHVLHWIGQQQQQHQDEKAALEQLARQHETALQREVNAHKSAQEKLQKLARELDNRNRQLNESLLQSQSADKAKAEFLANMSHEIRTPLNAVIGVASLLDRSQLSDRQRQQVGMIFESGKSLLTTLNDVMDYVRIEAGEITLDAFPFNLAEAVSAVFMRHRELAQARGLEYSFLYGESLPRLFLGDGARIQQLLHSLLDNAVKFTHDGSVKVAVSGYSLQSGRYLMRIDVRDTGIGISAEQRDKLFDVFTQGDNSITRAYGGSGMGLAICSRLVKLMEGNLGVDSEPGRGSLFWVELPLRLYREV